MFLERDVYENTADRSEQAGEWAHENAMIINSTES
jgi:hypothetical protein